MTEPSLICVGGPCAGQQACVEGKRYIQVPMPRTGLLVTYERMAFHGNGQALFILVPRGTTGDVTLAALIAAYQPGP